MLGEVEDAIQCYSKCLRDGNSICLDRRFIIEAAGSLQKAEVRYYYHLLILTVISMFLLNIILLLLE